MLVSVYLSDNNLNIHNTQTNSSCREIKLAFKSISKRLREISEEYVNQHKYKQERDISTFVLGISVLICKNSFTCIYQGSTAEEYFPFTLYFGII